MKTATQWKTRSGYDTATSANEGFSLLLETGFSLLLESSGELLLESTVITQKTPAQWDIPEKVRSAWQERDGYSTVTVGTGDTRLTEQGDTRITEQGDTRITEVATFSEKPRTAWTEA